MGTDAFEMEGTQQTLGREAKQLGWKKELREVLAVLRLNVTCWNLRSS